MAEIARRADDITGGGQFTERVRWGVVESRLFVFTATGWLQAVDDPAGLAEQIDRILVSNPAT